MFNPALTRASFPGGVDLGSAIVLPPGGEIRAYVRSTGPADGDPLDLNSKLVTTLNAGLARCRASRGDVVIVLPGHTENISSADQMSSLVAGTRIIGCGYGTMRPTFTWTAATSTFLFDVANTSLENCRLFLAGPHAAGTAVTVAAPITVTGANCAITGCEIWCGFDADQICTIPITVPAGGDGFLFQDNVVNALVAAPCTTFLRLTDCDDVVIENNRITVATTAAAVGVIQALTTAPLRTTIRYNVLNNLKADSTCALTPMAAQTGEISDNYLVIQSTGLAHITTGSAMSRFNNYGVNTGGDETGALLGTASA